MMVGPDTLPIRRRPGTVRPRTNCAGGRPLEDMTVMNASIPLPTLRSHALVAFTIEFDNEAEGQIIHRTTKHGASPGSRQGPWLVSLVMWANCMQFIDKKGVAVRELESRAPGQRRIWRAWRGGDTLLSNHRSSAANRSLEGGDRYVS
jgi:hypothetical protein